MVYAYFMTLSCIRIKAFIIRLLYTIKGLLNGFGWLSQFIIGLNIRVHLVTILLVTVKPAEMEFDLDKALEDVPIHVEDGSSRTPPTPSQVQQKLEQQPGGAMVELPSEEEKKLQHFTKLRPRRNKKMHSSKVAVSKSSASRASRHPAQSIVSLTCNVKLMSKDGLDCTHGSDKVSLDSETSSFSKSAVLRLRMASRMV